MDNYQEYEGTHESNYKGHNLGLSAWSPLDNMQKYLQNSEIVLNADFA